MLVGGLASAEGGTGSVYAGINQANYGIATDGQGSPTHQGIETGIGFSRQPVDGEDGYVLESDAYLNKGLAGSRDSASARLAAYRLATLNPRWLLRAGGQRDYYRSDDFPTDSYQGIAAEVTLTHLGIAREGTEIFLSDKREKHGQVDTDQYRMGRRTLRLTKFIPQGDGAAYWSLYGAYQQNDASDNNRDATTTVGGIQYNQWELGSVSGQLGLQWSQDRTGQYQTDSSLASVSLTKRLQKGGSLQLSSNTGKYASPVGTETLETKHFYSVSAGLKWDF